MKLRDLGREIAATAHLAGPLIGGQLAYTGLNVLDTLMAGALGPVALGAVGVGASAWQIMHVLLAGTLHGATPSAAHLYGEGRYERVGGVFRQALWLSQALALLGIAYLVLAAPALLRLLHVEPALVPTAEGYLRALAFGAPAVVVFYALRFTSEGVSLVRPTLYLSLAALPVNAFLNWVFMFGKFGAPELGAVGTGVATAIVWWLQALSFWLYARRSQLYRRFELFGRFERIRWPELGSLVRLGLPIGAAWFMEVSLFGLSGLLIGSLGTTIIGGHQIALNVASLTFMIPFGFAMATTVRVGQALGAGDRDGAARAAWSGILTALGIQTCTGTAMLLFPRAIAGLYTRDLGVQDVAVSLLFLAAIFQISDGAQAAAAGALRGYKDTRFVMLITCISYWVVGLPLAYYLGFGVELGARGMWMGFIGGLTVAAVLLAWRLRTRTAVERLL
jgi:multidrug resistance protein, MATE family